MTITVTNIEQGPFVATGNAQTVSYTFMTLTDTEIDVFYQVGDGERVLLDPALHTVRPNKSVEGDAVEGGTVEIAALAVPAGASIWLVAAPLSTRQLQWRDAGSRLRNLNEEQDRDALRDLVNRRLASLGIDVSARAIAIAEDAKAIAEGAVGDWVVLDTLQHLRDFKFGGAPIVYVLGRYAEGDGYFGVFRPVSGDRSEDVSLDVASAIWVAPDGQDGTEGAWCRVYDGMARLSWFRYGSDVEAVQAASALGYLFVDRIFTVDEDVTIDVPQYYDGLSGFHIEAGKKLTISDTIHAPNQWIFSGEGDVVIPLPDEDSGEDIREVRAKWFGAFTQVPLDQAPRIQKAINALGNSREGVVWFDCGSYNIDGEMTVGRGVKLASTAGTRRTVFQVVSDGYPVFRTLHTAVMFKDIQFENHPVSLTRVYPFIQINHDFCEIEDIFHQSAKNAIVVNGPNCKIRNVEGVYGGSDPGPNSSQILVQAEGCEIDGVRARYSSGGGPTAIVEIGTGATSNVTAFYIRNVETRYGSTAVLINAANVTVARGQISDIRYRGSSAVDATVRIKTSGNGSVFGVTINNISGAATGTGLVRMEQASTGSIRDIMFDNIHDSGTTGAAFDLVQTSGELKDIRVGPNVVTSRPNLIQTTGTVTGIKSEVKRRVGKTANFTVPASGAEDGILYNVVSASAITATLPAEAIEPLEFEIASTGAGVTTLTAAAGAQVNGGASFALTAGKLYKVAVARNVGGTAAQWVVMG